MSAPKDPEKYVLWKRNLSEAQKRRPPESEETRRKKSENGKGRTVPLETRQKLSEALMGHQVSEETRRKIGAAGKGKNIGNKHALGSKRTEAEKQQISERLKGHPFWGRAAKPKEPKCYRSRQPISEETRQRISESSKGRKMSEKQKQALSERMRGNTYTKGRSMTDEDKQKISKASKGHVVTEETRRKIAAANTGKIHSEETCSKISSIKKGQWNTSEYATRVLCARGKCPNKLEQKVQYLLDELSTDNWIFTGDGSRPVGGKHPDFSHISQSLLLEVFGDYWHCDDDPQERIDYFRQFGYKTLVIWEHEVNSLLKCPATFSLEVSNIVHKIWRFVL